MFRLAAAVLIVLGWGAFAAADDVKIVLWNGEELFTEADVQAKAAQMQQLVGDLEPDILLIDEVCSLAVVEKVRDVMGLTGYHVACSDFNQRDDQMHSSFEVGIISRYRIDRIVEFDQTPDNKFYGRDGEPDEIPLQIDRFLKLGVQEAGVGRGFLWARFDELELTLCVTHLKSSRSGDDRRNAMKREYVAAAMAGSVLDDTEAFPDYSYLVIGDLNVGATDTSKIGTNLVEDETDGYDDTHAILGGGLIRGLRMKNLTQGVGETYDDRPRNRFVGSGPIDNIYVSGANEADFGAGQKSTNTYGSDHFAVWTVYQRP